MTQRSTRKQPPPTPKEKRERAARKEIGQIYRGLRNLRGLFVADAVLLGVIFVFSLATGSLLFQAISGVMFAAAVAGSVLVVQQPYLWSLVLALGHSPLAVLGALSILFGGANLVGIVSVGLAVMLWMAVRIGARAHRLLKRHPDAWDGGRASYTGRRSEEMDSKWADRAREAKRKRTRNILLYVGIPLVLLVLAVVFLASREPTEQRVSFAPAPIARPTAPLAPQAARFGSAWNASDLYAVMELVLPAERTRLHRLTAKIVRRRKWTGAFPAAGAARLEEHDAASFYAWHDLTGYGSVRVSWQWIDDAWWIVRFKFKKGT